MHKKYEFCFLLKWRATNKLSDFCFCIPTFLLVQLKKRALISLISPRHFYHRSCLNRIFTTSIRGQFWDCQIRED